MDNNIIDLEVNKSNIEENRKVLFICTVCGTKCSNKQNMNRHMKNIHNNLSKTSRHPDGGNYSCPLCFYRSNSIEQILTHVEEEHDRKIEKRIMKFDNFEEFVKWKTIFENENKCHYVIARSKKTNNKKYMYYFCHRSGFYKPNLKTGKRQRKLKMKGSNKMNSTCTSHITATILFKTNRVKVTHILTHIGHDNEIGKLRMVAKIGCDETFEIDDSNINQSEFEVISSQLSAGIEHKDAVTSNKKLGMEEINKLSKKLSEAHDLDQILYITRNLSTINAGVDALQKSKSVLISNNKLPANKKAPQQCRRSLPSLQKKRKREKPSSTPSQNDEDLTILNMIMPK